jgi:hypothetical protein
MARFRTTQAFHAGSMRVAAGRTVADTVGNAQAGDVVVSLTAQSLPPGMVPLDGSATTMKNASPFASKQVRTWITGADSISA